MWTVRLIIIRLLTLLRSVTTGLQFTHDLRAAGISPVILPIIIMSTHNTQEVVEAAYETGANDWMSKPTNTREVAARVRDQARLRTIPANAARTPPSGVAAHHDGAALMVC